MPKDMSQGLKNGWGLWRTPTPVHVPNRCLSKSQRPKVPPTWASELANSRDHHSCPNPCELHLWICAVHNLCSCTAAPRSLKVLTVAIFEGSNLLFLIGHYTHFNCRWGIKQKPQIHLGMRWDVNPKPDLVERMNLVWSCTHKGSKEVCNWRTINFECQ